jgi:hypothetical protein
MRTLTMSDLECWDEEEVEAEDMRVIYRAGTVHGSTAWGREGGQRTGEGGTEPGRSEGGRGTRTEELYSIRQL